VGQIHISAFRYFAAPLCFPPKRNGGTDKSDGRTDKGNFTDLDFQEVSREGYRREHRGQRDAKCNAECQKK